MPDLVIRNEDRLPCRHLHWRGNSANLLLADKTVSASRGALEEALDYAINRYRPRVIRALQKDRRSSSVDCRMKTNIYVLGDEAADSLHIFTGHTGLMGSFKFGTSSRNLKCTLDGTGGRIEAPAERRQVFHKELQRVITGGAVVLRELGNKLIKME